MSALFIEDGYTQTKTIPAVLGMHPILVIVYRPAIHRERIALKMKFNTLDPAVYDNHEIDLIAKHLVSINGEEIPKARLSRLKPTIRVHLIDLILGHDVADEVADVKN